MKREVEGEVEGEVSGSRVRVVSGSVRVEGEHESGRVCMGVRVSVRVRMSREGEA